MVTSSTQNTKTNLGITLIREIEAAIKRFNMYPAGHPASKNAAEIPFNTLKAMFSDTPQVIIGILEGKLAVNGKSVEGIGGRITLEEALTNLNLHSISITSEITLPDLQKFLEYFIGKTGGKIDWNNLEEFIAKNDISGIAVDELRYELVGKDQTIVDGDAFLGGGEGSGGSAAGVAVAELFADNPELILGLLADKNSAKKGISERYAHAIDFDKVTEDIESEIGDLSDEQMMKIITAGLKENIRDDVEYDEVDVQDTLFKINDLLEKRNKAELVPKVKKLAEDLHLIDDRFINMILDKKYSRKKLAFEELETAREALEQGAMLTGKMSLIAKRLEVYDDQTYTQDFIGSLVKKLNSDDEGWREVADGFDQVLEGAVESESDHCLEELYKKILESLKDYNLSDDRFQYYMDKAKKLMGWLSVEERLNNLNDLFDVVSVYTSKELMTSPDKRQAALDFYDRVGTNEFTGSLIKLLESKFEALNKLIFGILEHIQTQTVTLKLCEYLSYHDRAIRLFNIRLLSEFKELAPRAFELIISDKKLRDRPAGQNLLETEKWYKLRNIILICGNIATPEAIKILEGFVSDPDPRIAEEMILALEKIKAEKACTMITSYLYFNDSKIRLRAAVALANVGIDDYFGKLVEAFRQETEVQVQMIPIVARLGQEKSLPFFKQLLMDQKDSVWKSFLGKSSDDFKLHILSALKKIPSQKTLKLLSDYKQTFGKGLGSLFRSNRALVALEETQRSIETKLEHQAVQKK